MKNEIINVKKIMKDIRNGNVFIVNRLKIEICNKTKDTFLITTSDLIVIKDIVSAKKVRWLLKII